MSNHGLLVSELYSRIYNISEHFEQTDSWHIPLTVALYAHTFWHHHGIRIHGTWSVD